MSTEGPHDPGSWVGVATVADLAPDSVTSVRLEPLKRTVALVRAGEEFFALDGRCPHREGPLGTGVLRGGALACPWHGFRFDLHTGQAVLPNPHPGVQIYPTRVVDGQIQILAQQQLTEA